MPMFRPAPQILGPVSILSSLRAEKHSNSLKWLKMIIENRITISTESQAESYMTSEEVLAVIWNSMLYSATHSVGCCKNWRGHRPTWSGQAISFWIWLNGHTANAVSTGLGTASGVSGLIDMGLSPVVGGASPGGVPLPKVSKCQNSSDGTFGTPDRKRWYFWNFWHFWHCGKA